MLYEVITDIDNWVLWKPGGSFWYATNAERVISQGVELQTDVTVNVFNSEINGGLVFSYNPVSRKEVLNIRITSYNVCYTKLLRYNRTLFLSETL